MATLLKQDGSAVKIELKSLSQLQHIVGGWLEMVRIDYGMWVLCDEEGRLKGRGQNVVASLFTGVDLVGDVVIATAEEVKEWDDMAAED